MLHTQLVLVCIMDKHMYTHIIVTFRYDHKSVVDYLVSLPQVDVGAKNSIGWNALHYASR